MFKRSQDRSLLAAARDSVYPKGGWRRAFYYILYRVKRIPDSPGKIARGVFMGIFVCFTPFFGLHILLALLLTFLIRGNLLAAGLATFVGNPLTFPFIATLSLQIGNWLVGTKVTPESDPHSGMTLFRDMSQAIWGNLRALFTDRDADWSSFSEFSSGILLPYLVGGALPGLVAASVAAWLSLSVISAYQRRRRLRFPRRKKTRVK